MFRFGLVVGFGAGYVLGAKAGRERYYELVRMYERLTGDERFQQVMEKGKAVIDLSAERAREAMSEGFSMASRKVRDAAAGDGARPMPL
ncbi:MAG: hypothetical protein M3N51_00535 [Actinomycetota bacterium]|nr:hypothetical protein [Actinomycetota bacterium]